MTSDFYKSEYMRKRLEAFSHGLSSNYNSKLIFTANTCTDGQVMQINPSTFFDFSIEAKEQIRNLFNISSDDILHLLSMKADITHEAMHDRFSNFQIINEFKDRNFSETQKGLAVLHKIWNIGEDRFIEDMGKKAYKGARKYLLLSNAMFFYDALPYEEYEKKNSELDTYLYWAMLHYIVGKDKGSLSSPLVLEVIEKTSKYWDKFIKEVKSEKRYEYAKKIFTILKKYFNFEDFKQDNKKDYSNPPEANPASQKTNDRNSNEANSMSDDSSSEDTNSSNKEKSKENKSGSADNKELKEEKSSNSQKSETSIKTPFGDFSEKDFKDLEAEAKLQTSEMKNFEDKIKKEKELEEKEEKKLSNKINELNNDIKYSDAHTNVKIRNNLPELPSDNLTYQYELIASRNKQLVNQIVKKWTKLILDNEEDFEEDLFIGSKLDETKLWKKDKLFWKEDIISKTKQNLSVEILVDGSQSMTNFTDKVKEALVIILEVCLKMNIPISIVEHRAVYAQYIVDNNIKFDFNSSPKYKSNIISIKADSNTREGVSLKFAYEYQKKQCSPDTKRLLIAISDGLPYHIDYRMPFSGKDTREVAQKIEKDKSCNLVCLSIDSSVTKDLKNIYKNVIEVSNLNDLPKNLTKQIEKNLFK